MKLYGEDLVAVVGAGNNQPLKLVINETAAYLFPSETQHRNATQPGLCYRDDSAGNALAATIKSGRIDIRRHNAFSDERVQSIMRQFLGLPQIQPVAGKLTVFYQGRKTSS